MGFKFNRAIGVVWRITHLFLLLSVLALAGCSITPVGNSNPASKQEIAQLAQLIGGLGADVDPVEAENAARIAIEYSLQLAHQYQITDPPLIHNFKVNQGLRPRGLCYQWADDIEARLRRENFTTLDLHRAIANADHPVLISHSTTIISRSGEGMFQGVILDPWRYGGRLFWSSVGDDERYDWVPRSKVFEKRSRHQEG